MGSKFIEKHKKKSILAAILLLFRGRAKYFLPLLLVGGVSTPFIATSENVSRIIELPSVASFLKFTGLSKVFSVINPAYSAKDLKETFAKVEAYDKSSSFWKRLFQKRTSNTPGSHSSIALVTGTDVLREEGGGNQEARGKKQEARSEEKASGKKGNVPDIQNMLAGLMGGNNGGNDGLLGNLMGENLADRMSGGGSAGYGRGSSPYMNKDLMAMNTGVVDKDDALYNAALNKASESVPLSGKPADKVNKRKMGKASGFSWKNVGYRGKKTNTNLRGSSDKRAMFQLSETYSTTGSAYNDPNSAYEYQAAYVGSTYDGNDMDADIMDPSASVPDAAFTSGLLSGVSASQEVAKECTDAQAVQGKKMSEDADEIDAKTDALGSPPDCCDHGAVAAYNSKLDGIKVVCEDFNVNAGILSEKCRGLDQKMSCSMYDSMKVQPCDCDDDFGGALNWILIVLGIIAVVVAVLLFWCGGVALLAWTLACFFTWSLAVVGTLMLVVGLIFM
ncbi:MAG: tetraspanin family protein [Elusimicrobia bacterium]|nr:tetraspanin family protein [Elusimicrobiota bacterium]